MGQLLSNGIENTESDDVVATFCGIPVVKSEGLRDRESATEKELFEAMLCDANHNLSRSHIDELGVEYNEYGHISLKALLAMDELNRRGSWQICDVEIAEDSRMEPVNGRNSIRVKSPKTVEIKMRKGY